MLKNRLNKLSASFEGSFPFNHILETEFAVREHPVSIQNCQYCHLLAVV